ncbi:uncharacterized protein LOC113750016 isoform X2 [Coffea eugenioides]|uniref:Uncharacterized protein LOC113712957 isoform X2 n=1 Tax=Coffea arabica TaxID=13443 RepID=A0A6P6UPZ7_COFAR|nr:uncharacterized protein LOC113712957 isoform X2 [Coffea arabica]XP_027092420.1 uncharacterized protein LOC113712957 isoform X2 [Coffea arabica]XP_027092421.1 uncharacterized protein LOC113712957 isoform X2 [Coffea arabica]XP_027092422.1 uncharacterized protein LOC113712957 isoform X2 [Coffea arabica]XP_027092423.1 uncharacterized protein LOC113712957 isoform X2 [Coffea arabica]XP_027092424.1 uncharacterized protein LOC113712957 isoform X2 [Coffea arabica]XP_027092425.1 uncharacterized prot
MDALETFRHSIYQWLLIKKFKLDSTSVVANNPFIAVNFPNNVLPNVIRRPWKFVPPSRKWELHSTAQTKSTVLSDEEKKSWDACRPALSAFEFTVEEEDKILGKAFGHIHSPYWSEERKMEVPRFDVVSEILSYLRSLNLADDDLSKLLKKFPEVLGCSLEDELKNNVKVMENEWGIEGKTLKNLLMRNPRVLGYNVDCKGDCMAKCTRCWVRF